MKVLFAAALLASLLSAQQAQKGKKKQPPPTPLSALDKYVEEALRSTDSMKPESAGSLWSASSILGDLASDVRSRNVNDLVSIQVAENVSAVSGGVLASSR